MLYVPPTGSTDPNASYVGKNVAGGTQGSKVPPRSIEAPQREIMAIIAAAQAMGLDAPSNTDLAQMLKAVRSGVLGYFVAAGTPDAVAITPNPVCAALVPGMRFRAKVAGSGSNTTTKPNLVVNGIVAPILLSGGGQIALGDIVAGRTYAFDIDDSGNARFAGPAASEIAGGSSSALTTYTTSKTIIGGRLLFFQFTAGTYQWTCPSGVNQARVRGQAAGGAGGAGNGYAGAGGFGGNYFEGVFDFVPGQVYTIQNGQGGRATSGTGGNGGSTFIKRPDGSVMAICYGGAGGGPGGNSGSNNIGQTGTQAGRANNAFPYGGYELLAGIPQQGIILPGPTNIGGLGSGSALASGTVQPYNGGAFDGNAPGGGASGGSANSIGGNGADGALFIEG